MIFIYILLGIAAIILSYICFIAICSLCVNPKKEYTKNSPFYRGLLYGISAPVLKLLGVRVHTSGLEMLPKDQKLLFVGNHRSNFDPIIEWLALKPWQVAFISKKANFSIPFFGRIIRKCCFLMIDRENPRNALVTFNTASKLIKSGEVSIGVYPEGTRSKSTEMLPFHDGVFFIAQKANCPIAVMSLQGTEQIHKNVFRRHTDIYLDIVLFIPTEEVKSVTTHVIGANVRTALEESFNKVKS